MNSGMTAEQMVILKQLSDADERLSDLAARKQSLNEKISSLEGELEDEKFDLENRRKAIKDAQHEEHKEEISLKEMEEELNKTVTLLNVAKTNEELRILKKKRDKLREEISRLEDEALERLAQIDRENAEIELYDETLKKKAQEIAQKIAELQLQIKQCEDEEASVKKQRRMLAEQVEKDFLSKYERVLAKEKHHPVVAVRNKTCQGCFMSVTLQEINRIWRGEDIVLCRNCNRILYLPEEERQKEAGSR